MGCKYCTYFSTESEGDYGEYTYDVCNAEAKASHLKHFPFKKVPKSCKGTFTVGVEHYPNGMRYWEVLNSMCDTICSRSLNNEIKSDERKGCSPWKCDAFTYVLGRTDMIKSKDHYLTEEEVREMLEGKKFKIRNSQMKEEFQVVLYKTCPSCNGDNVKMKNKYIEVCPHCECGKVAIGTSNP